VGIAPPGSALYRRLFLTRDEHDAQDLLQETYLRAYRFWHRFTPGTNCRAWLLTILHNAYRNAYRDRFRDQLAVEFDETALGFDAATLPDVQWSDPETVVFSQLLDGEIHEALQRLPIQFFEVVMMIDIHELTYEEAAAVIGSPVGTVRSRLSRGRRLLQAALADYARGRGIQRGGAYAVR